MPVTVEVDGAKATIDARRWKSEDPVLERTLNLLLDPVGSWPWDPDADRSAAEAAAKILGGTVLTPALGRADVSILRALAPAGSRVTEGGERPVIGFFHEGDKVIPVHAGDAMPGGAKALPKPMPQSAAPAPKGDPRGFAPAPERPKPFVKSPTDGWGPTRRDALLVMEDYQEHAVALKAQIGAYSAALAEVHSGANALDDPFRRWAMALMDQQEMLQVERINSEREMRARVLDHLSARKPLSIPFSIPDSGEDSLDDWEHEVVATGVGIASRLISADGGLLAGSTPLRFFRNSRDGRSYYDFGKQSVFLAPGAGAATVAHETVHHIVHLNPGLAAACARYHQERAGAQWGHPGFPTMIGQDANGAQRFAYPADFPTAYMGRVYKGSDGKWIAGEEILPCWTSMAAKDPAKLLADEDLFRFGHQALRGKYV